MKTGMKQDENRYVSKPEKYDGLLYLFFHGVSFKLHDHKLTGLL